MAPPGRSRLPLRAALLCFALTGPAFAEPDLIGPHAREAAAHRGQPDAPRDFAPAASSAASTPKLARRVYGYLPYWEGIGATFRWDLISDLVIFSADLKSDGSVTSWHGWPQTALIAGAHAHSVRVHLSATLFNTGAGEISTFLDSASARQKAISALVAAVANAGADGLDYDFEVVATSHKAAFTSFVQATHTALLSAVPQAELTLAMPANTSAGGYDSLALEAATERLLLMEYDYHWSTSPTAGPVAQLTTGGFWGGSVEGGVNSFLTAGVKPGSIAMGVPYYGYDWPTQGSAMGARVVLTSAGTPTPGTATLVSACYPDYAARGRTWDAASQTPWTLYTSSTGALRQLWCDDAESLSRRYQFVNSKDLAGVMIWALGYDGARSEMWGALEAELGSGGAADAGASDAGPGAEDAGASDAGAADAGSPDAGPGGDGGAADGGAHGLGQDAGPGDPGTGSPDGGAGNLTVPAAPSQGCGQAGAGGWFALFGLLGIALRARVRRTG